MGDTYGNTWDVLCKTIGAAEGKSSGFFHHIDHLTIDQQLKVAQIGALLSISEELSAIRHQGINPEFDTD
ncbi:hypothetical protein [[Mycobacterium] burgundiense]|uniref:Uncharacterized protein n=1 Tax=[Mycobacterium] burgundiense TaxID=3064286 RepID=A0ABM9LVZ7_9MYCO|nr:hypothetical protein [Mycolicibacterium sp. MU0053]CAJ1505660.1 hypothetical protein MU0053_002995 [Mycolicibacterium sp. MU0053]